MSDFDLPDGATLDNTQTAPTAPADPFALPEGANLSYDGTSNEVTDPNSLHAKTNKYLMDNMPGLIHALNSFGKGIPISGQFMGNTPGQEEYEKEHPITSGAERAIGAVAGSAPLAASALAPEAGAIYNILKQGALFGSLGTADKAAQKYNEGGMQEVTDTPASEYAKTFGINGLFGALGEGVGRVISPNAIPKPAEYKMPDFTYSPTKFMVTDDGMFIKKPDLAEVRPETSNIIETAINNGRNNARNEQIQNMKDSYLDKALNMSDNVWHVLGGLVGHFLGGGADSTLIGMFGAPYLKAAVKEHGPEITAAYRANQLMASPAKKAILNSILGEGANSATND